MIKQKLKFNNYKAIKTYKSLVSAAAHAGWDLLDFAEQTQQIELQEAVFTTECTDTFFAITVNDILPRMRDEKFTQLYWNRIITTALKNCTLNFNRLLIIFDIHAPGQWDCDNKAIKTPIDAIRYARLVPDDNIHYVTFMVTGRSVTSDFHTTIYLTEASDVHKYMECKNNL